MASYIENNLLEKFSNALSLGSSSIDTINNEQKQQDRINYDQLRSSREKIVYKSSENLENDKRDLNLWKLIVHEERKEDDALLLSERTKKCSLSMQKKKVTKFLAEIEKKKQRSLIPRCEFNEYMDKRIVAKLNGSRLVEGVLRGFDPFLNLVVDEGIEIRKNEEKVNIGVVVIRGSSIVMLEAKDRIG
ncbi:UNVERIFIED_CONTAM: hypothetical protein RMT77_016226 [Armadillidium vulgare]